MAGSVKVKGYTRKDGVKVKGFTRKSGGKVRRKVGGRKRRSTVKHHVKRIMRTPEFKRAASMLMKRAHSKAGTRRRKR